MKRREVKHESLDRETVLRLLEELRHKDSRRGVFGAAEHGYTLNPPIPLSTIEGFEARHGIRLPEDYRYFITEIKRDSSGTTAERINEVSRRFLMSQADK